MKKLTQEWVDEQFTNEEYDYKTILGGILNMNMENYKNKSIDLFLFIENHIPIINYLLDKDLFEDVSFINEKILVPLGAKIENKILK